MGDPATATAIVTIAAKLVDPIGRYIVRPIARRCPFKNLWEYKSNLQNLETELKKLEDKSERVRGLTYAGVEPQPDVNDWLGKATSIINEVLGLISKDTPERGCCEGCTYSNLKGSYQHRNNVARKLKDVAQLLQEAMRFTSLWEYKSNLENLKKEVEKLVARRESVQLLIKVGEEPLPEVKLWQDKVDNIIDEVRLINENNPEHQNNPEQQNKVAQVLRDVDGLLQEEAQFKGFSYQPIPKQTCLQPSTQQEFSESRASILKDIIAALRNTDINKVGIHGIGGVGKTTLAKKVEIQAMQDTLFDKIVFVEVSQSLDIRNIQGVIADYLGLRLEEETESGRAMKLCDELKKEEKKILIILDNLWKGIKLEKVGIPFGNECKGLKLLLTARSRNVLIKEMDSQHNFHVEALSAADAWILFKSIAGTCVDHPHLKTTAIQVAKKCGGMPLAIVTVAKALKDEAEEQWQDALRSLSNPSSESFEGITEEVYNSIKLSYDYLHEKLKKIFLLCSRMGCTYDASVQDLFRYGLGLGFFKGFNTVKDALCHLYASVDQLKAASLLLDAPDKFSRLTPVYERFAIHDVICDVARSIASKDLVFTVLDDQVMQFLTNENTLQNCTSITLDNICELPKDLQLVCPQLKFLYVESKSSFLKNLRISDKFFALMPKLQVLHLIGMDLQPLSTPFSDLVNLQTLCLEYCVLNDIADIGDLKTLEILSLRACQVLKLPEKMPQLTKLRLLECSRLGSIPSEFILSFKRLEALYMRECVVKESNNGCRNVSLEVLEHLSNLTILELRVEDATLLRSLLSPKLERYNITIGSFSSAARWFKWNIRCKTSRFLQVKLITNEEGVISRLKPIRQLVLDEVPDIANNFCGLDGMGFPELEDLQVQNNSHILHIVDTVSHVGAFPILKSLILLNLINLKTICNGPLGMELFHQVRTIKVELCNELTSFFSLASDRDFQELEEIEVEHCKKMKEIFAISEQVHKIKFSKLRILRLTSLPQLKSLCCNVKTTMPVLQLTSDTKPREINLEEDQHVLKPLFNEKVVATNLETLAITDINVKMLWDNKIPAMSSIQNLTCLIISNLANLRKLGSGDHIKFPSLTTMSIKSCPKFKEILFDDKVGVPSLENITISKMDNLKMIWHNQLVEDSFPKLKSLQVKKCQKLLTLFPSNMRGRLLSLENLNVSGCGSLEEILDLRGISSEESHPTTSTQLRELRTYSPLVLSFADLQTMEVSECQNLKAIVAKEEVEAKESPGTARFVFHKLISLKLYKLPELRTFYPSGYTMEWPALKMLKINQHSLGHKWPNKVGFEFEVGKIWLGLLPTLSSWVHSLTRLILHGCGNLEALFPCSMIVTEELREKKTGNIMVFAKLNYLEMKQLANLKGLCFGCHIEFPVLKKFKISNCPELSTFIFDDKVKVPRLKELKIASMDNLKMIWDNQLVENFIPELESLYVEGCQKLLSLKATEDGTTGSIIVFPKLNYLEMKQLANLKGLCSGCHIEFPILKEFKISNCPEFSAFIFDDKVKVPSLKKLEIASMDNLKMIWDNQLTENFIPELKSLQVEGCWNPLTLSRSNVDGRLWSLETLDVTDCGSLEEIFDLHEKNSEERHSTTSTQSKKLYTTVLSFTKLQNLKVSECGSLKSLFSEIGAAEETHVAARFVFPKLTSLELYKLPELETIYPGRYIVEWPVLRRLWLCDCGISDTDDNKLMQQQSYLHRDEFSSLSNIDGLEIHIERIWLWLLPLMSSIFQNLTKLVVYDCGNLKELFPSFNLVEQEFREKKMGNTIFFPNLECLEMECLANLTRLCSGYYIEFPSLKECRISNCPELKAFIFDHKVKVPNLKKVEISSMDNLKMIWDKQLVENFIPKLKSLQVEGCQKLLILFQSNVYGKFLSLKTLEVSDCGSLEEIFDIHEINSEQRHSTTPTQSNELYTTVLSFVNLQNLKVSECKSLKSLFSDRGAAEETHAIAKFVFPELASLELHKLPKLRTFYLGRYTVEGPFLRKLKLWDSGIPNIDDEDQMHHPLFLVEKAFPCLENLILSGRELMMMWQGQDPERLVRNFKILQVLDESKAEYLLGADQPVLHYIGNVKYMWKQNFILDLILPNFGKIRVEGCDSFISLIPPSASFQSLTSLEVHGCNSLEYIGTFSIVKNLVKLVHLTIHWCKKIVEVVGNHGDVPGDKILFSNLKSLSLVGLLSVTSFCSGNFTLEFPSLEELYVYSCPNMKIFYQGDLITQKLQEVKIDYKLIVLCPDFDVNAAIQQFHERKQVAIEESSQKKKKVAMEDWSNYSTDESTQDWSTDESKQDWSTDESKQDWSTDESKQDWSDY